MTLFRVWAPKARRVNLALAGRTIAMSAVEAGWWELEEAAPPGSDYAFSLDGGKPLPDPRSPWQPQGVHGPSRTVDHGAFRWQHDRWYAAPLSSAVIYELHVGTFTPSGSFDGVIERLDHLSRLGVTHVEIMPVAEFPGSRGWGYDGVDLYAVREAYGGPHGLKRLVDACHGRGLGVILDVVYNHLGPDGNYLEAYGPYFTERYATPWGKAVNLDGAGSDEARRFFIDNALMWLRDYRIDGLRLDAVHAFLDTSAEHLLEQMQADVEVLSAQVGRELVLIAESNANDPRLVWGRERGGYGLRGVWSDDFHHALHCVLTGEQDGYYADFGSIADLGKALGHAWVYDGRYSPFRGRRHGRPADGLTAQRFVVAAQNHDQVGNRARGERLSHLVGVDKARVAAALLLTAPQVPLLFQGEEWAASAPFQYFTDHADPELGRAVTEGRRREFAEFGWKPEDVPSPQAPETFEASRLEWSEIEHEPHASMLTWYRGLIALRRSLPDLSDGRFEQTQVRCDEAARWLTMQRGRAIVAVNLAPGAQTITLPAARFELLLASQDAVPQDGSGIYLPPDSVAIALRR